MIRTLLHKTMLTAIAILLGGLATVAQQYVVKGSMLSFKVEEVANYAYHWSVTHTTTNTVSYLTSKTYESGDFVFADEGAYEVKVYPEDLATHCFGDPLIMMVVADGAAPTAVFDDLEVPYVCSANNGGDANGKISISVKYTGPKPWTFKYSVDRAPAIMPEGADELYVNEFEFELEIPNTTGKTHRAEILLVEAKTLSGIPAAEDLPNQTLEVDVMALPNTLFGDYAPVMQAGTIQSFTATIEKNENYEIFVPVGATVISQSTVKLSDKFHSELSFDVQWGNTPGDYQVKLMERTAFDCAGDTIYADVTLVESFVVSLGGDIEICEGDAAILTPTIDFDGTYTYLWSDGSIGETLSVSESGTYSVTATDTGNGKSSSATTTVAVSNLPVVDLGGNYELAEGEDRVLDAGNPGLTYAWSTGETSQQITVNSSGTFSVDVTNADGCVGTDEVVISSVNDVFAIELGETKNICDGEEIVLNPNPTISQNYSYLWSNGAGTSTLTVSESGTYSVTVLDDLGNEKTDDVEVIVHELPIVDLGEDVTLYDGETATLTPGDLGVGAVYEWSTGESTQSITVTEENVYSVRVTTASSCTNTDDISVIRKDGHKFSVDLGGDIEICAGDRVYLEASIDRSFGSEPTYSWAPSGETEKGIFVEKTGKYCVEVTDPFGNVEGDCVELTVNLSPIVDLGEDLTVQTGDNVTLDAENDGSFYLWSTDDISQTIDVTQAGEYWVEVTNTTNCVGRDTVVVSFPEGDQFVGLATGFSPNGDGENDILFVRGNNIGSMNLIIYNRLGHKIFQSNRQDIGWDGTYRGQKQDMDVYVYFLQVTFLDGTSVQKRGNVTLLY